MTTPTSARRPEVWLSLPGDWTEFRVGHRPHHELLAGWLEERAGLPQAHTIERLDALASAGGCQLLARTDAADPALVVTAWPLPGSAEEALEDLLQLTRAHGGGQQEVLEHTRGYRLVALPRSGPSSASVTYLVTHPDSAETFLLDVTCPDPGEGGVDRELYDAIAAGISWQPMEAPGA